MRTDNFSALAENDTDEGGGVGGGRENYYSCGDDNLNRAKERER